MNEYEAYKKKALKDPAVRAAYEALETEYGAVQTKIERQRRKEERESGEETDRKTAGKNAMRALEELQQEAEANGVSGMNLEKINAEIAAAREDLKRKREAKAES